MRIAYQMPQINVINAHRTIYNWFKNAFIDLGHDFFTYTANDNLWDFLLTNKPDIFITSSHFYYKKYLDFSVLQKYRKNWWKVFVKIDFWDSPLSKGRINEAKSLKDDTDTVEKIKSWVYGDIFFHVVEQWDIRMVWFTENTWYPYYTIPLAADKVILQWDIEEKFKADISFIGTNLPQKREFFREWLFPLQKIYDVKLYGQDWTWIDRKIGFIQKIGQYFNIPLVKNLRKPKLKLEDEWNIYFNSKISVNIHEDYQREFWWDCNERTFKIPLCWWFEISDDVACIRKYFEDGKEIIIAKDKDDWYEKINYYMNHPEARQKIIDAGRKKVLSKHTYHNRVQQIIDIYNSNTWKN